MEYKHNSRTSGIEQWIMKRSKQGVILGGCGHSVNFPSVLPGSIHFEMITETKASQTLLMDNCMSSLHHHLSELIIYI